MVEIINYRGRSPDVDYPVRIYRNLILNCISIQQKGLVVGHVMPSEQSLILKNCRCVYWIKTQHRALYEQQRNVHAFIEGDITQENIDDSKLERISYNPFKKLYFYTSENEIELTESRLLNNLIIVKNNSVWLYKKSYDGL